MNLVISHNGELIGYVEIGGVDVLLYLSMEFW
jgi:hypothetical protein